MKPLIVVALLAIVISLGKALFSMSSGPDQSGRVVRALTWRIGLSVVLFGAIFASYHLGWIAPNSIH